MATEPMVIYSRKIDPAGVLGCVRALGNPRVTEGPGGWSDITITCRLGNPPVPATLTLSHSPEYYRGPDFSMQMRGMQGYFARFPDQKFTPVIAQLIGSFRFGLALHPPPEPELQWESDDERLKYLLAVLRHLDGVIFAPAGLFDASGRALCHISGEADPDAVMPAI